MHRHEHEETVDQSLPACRRLPAGAALAHLVRAAPAGHSGVPNLRPAVRNSTVGSVLGDRGVEAEQRSPVHDVFARAYGSRDSDCGSP